MRVSFVILILTVSLQTVAQNAAAPSLFDTQAAVAMPANPGVSLPPVKETKPGIFDRKFLALAGVATAATILDVVTTSRCMSTYVDCQEGNPLLGSHPSAAKLYGVSFSLLGAQVVASAWIRHEMPHRKLWMVPLIITSAGHGLGAILNLRTMHQIGSGQ